METHYDGLKIHVGPDGYPRLCVSGSLVLLHRIVAEKHFGKMGGGIEVHHKDGNKLNYAIENLELMTHRQHMLLHAREKLRERGCDPDTHGLCSTCKEIKPLSEFHSDKSRIMGKAKNCKACTDKRSKEWYVAHKERAAENGRLARIRRRQDPVWLEKSREKDRLNKRRIHALKKIASEAAPC
jgi:hypothetical protein